MGESKKDALRVNFDRKLKLEFHGVKVTSDAGLLAYREMDGAFGLTDMTACELTDNRTGKNTQHSLTALLRQLPETFSVAQANQRLVTANHARKVS